MLISQVIEQARSGELSNLTAVGFDDPKVLSYINLGMIELYKRFPIRSAEALITMRAQKTLYTLNSTDVDVALPMDTDIMVIQSVYDANGGVLGINDTADDYGVMTPSWNTIQIPFPAEGEVLSVVFTAGPSYISDATETLALPISLLEALLHYVGYRAHGALDGNIQAENNTHYQRFEASCKRASQLGMVTVDAVPTRNVTTKGFM